MDNRYKLVPQLEVYDSIGTEWIPNIMFSQSKNFRSAICNTDSYGLRYNNKKDLDLKPSIFDEVSSKEKCVIIGSSTAFGSGSTLDKNTLASLLSQNTDYHFYNLGIMSCNGFQELILFQSLINKIKNIKKIVIFSGINDLFFFTNSNFDLTYPGPFFLGNQYRQVMNNQTLGYKRKIFKFLFEDFFSNKINLNVVSINYLLKYMLSAKFRKNHKKNFILPNVMKIEDIVSRNLYLWSLISKTLEIDVHFFLQPFLGWGKNASKEEMEIQKNIAKSGPPQTGWEKINNSYADYNNLLKKKCDDFKIFYHDCNSFLKINSKKDDWLFVDRIHLNDSGYALISKYIKDNI